MVAEHNPILKRFSKIASKAEKSNGRGRSKRFFVMTHGRNNKTTDIGIYDGYNKKYAVSDVRAYNVSEILDEMEAMLRVNVPKQPKQFK